VEAMMAKPAPGKARVKTVRTKSGRTRRISYGQKGAKVAPGTKRGDSYCARSYGIKKRSKNPNDPNSANNLSRKRWKCKGKKSTK
jgi:hypothetical protein